MNHNVTESYQVTGEGQDYFPSNYRASRISPDTAKEIRPEEIFQGGPFLNFWMPLWSVGTPTERFRIIKPLSVHVYFDEGLFFVENETLCLFGTGLSREEAIDDLGLHMIHFSRYYESLDWSQVTGDAVRLKKLYEDLLSKE